MGNHIRKQGNFKTSGWLVSGHLTAVAKLKNLWAKGNMRTCPTCYFRWIFIASTIALHVLKKTDRFFIVS